METGRVIELVPTLEEKLPIGARAISDRKGAAIVAITLLCGCYQPLRRMLDIVVVFSFHCNQLKVARVKYL